MKKLFALITALVMLLSLATLSVAAANTTVDYSRTGSLTVYKTDKDGNALQGVVFTYLKIGNVGTATVGGTVETTVTALPNGLAELLALDVADSYTVDSISAALQAALDTNLTTASSALEGYIAAHGGTAMTETDAAGHTAAAELPLGLYLVVETAVPENVVLTTAPFIVTLPMTAASGDGWTYDVTVYPKNQTGDPTLDKAVREDGDEAYADTATASIGDVIEYRITSTLPVITSTATYLTTYTFVDVAESGIEYTRDPVTVNLYADSGLTSLAATWSEDDGIYTVTYADGTMTIAFTAAGLAGINAGCGSYTLEVCYTARLTADAVLGVAGNDNTVTLEWARTNTDYSDTLTDDCTIYTYGIELDKRFSAEGGDYTKVSFNLYNDTDGYYIVATAEDGIWTVTGTTEDEAEATALTVNADGKLYVRGIEPDGYRLTELTTAEGFKLLQSGIDIVITATEHGEASCTINGEDGNMTADGESQGAYAALTVVNNPETKLPVTGDIGTWALTIIGAIALAGAVVLLTTAKKKKAE